MLKTEKQATAFRNFSQRHGHSMLTREFLLHMQTESIIRYHLNNVTGCFLLSEKQMYCFVSNFLEQVFFFLMFTKSYT